MAGVPKLSHHRHCQAEYGLQGRSLVLYEEDDPTLPITMDQGNSQQAPITKGHEYQTPDGNHHEIIQGRPH